jgi:hypothetical protein
VLLDRDRLDREIGIDARLRRQRRGRARGSPAVRTWSTMSGS